MNKQAIRKAFIVCASIGIIYAGIAFNIQDKFSMKRLHDTEKKKGPKSLSIAIPKNEEHPAVPASGDTNNAISRPEGIKAPAKTVITGKEPVIEPSFLIAVPIVAYAINKGLIEKDGMILITKSDDQSSVYLKKPLDILKDKDADGLRSLSRMIGKKNIDSFLSKEGINPPDKSLGIDTIIGIGYSIDKNLLLNLYRKYVGESFKPLLPYTAAGFEISGKNEVFQLTAVKSNKYSQTAHENSVFVMPNVAGLSIKRALDIIAPRVESVKIHGSGIIVDQFPKPNEKVEKDTLCILYGRSNQR
jgi:hypothetical protein